MLHKLNIDLDYLLFAWQDDSQQSSYYLDTDTGSVVLVTRDLDDLDELRQEIELQPARFLYVPKLSDDQKLLDLTDFIFTVPDQKLKAMMEVACEGRDPFGACRTIMGQHPEELARWKTWQQDAAKERVRKWLAAHDLCADSAGDSYGKD